MKTINDIKKEVRFEKGYLLTAATRDLINIYIDETAQVLWNEFKLERKEIFDEDSYNRKTFKAGYNLAAGKQEAIFKKFMGRFDASSIFISSRS